MALTIFPEKLIPLVILKALHGEADPGLRRGRQYSRLALCRGPRPCPVHDPERWRGGRDATISAGTAERTNLDVVTSICGFARRNAAGIGASAASQLITLVADRPGHDRRYAMDITKVGQELCWTPRESFDSGLRKTVAWYLENRWWWEGSGPAAIMASAWNGREPAAKCVPSKVRLASGR